MNTHAEMLAVIAAHRDGKMIEMRRIDANGEAGYEAWVRTHAPKFQFSDYEYRIKPEPRKAREWFVITKNGKPMNRLYDSLDDAVYAQMQGYIMADEDRIIRVREVIEGEGE